MVKKTLCTRCGKQKSNDSSYQGKNWTCPACAQKEIQQLRVEIKKLEEKLRKQIKKMKSLESECIDCVCQRDDLEVKLSRTKFDLDEERKENERLNKEIEDMRDINRIKEEEILFVYKELERMKNFSIYGYNTLIRAN